MKETVSIQYATPARTKLGMEGEHQKRHLKQHHPAEFEKFDKVWVRVRAKANTQGLKVNAKPQLALRQVNLLC